MNIKYLVEYVKVNISFFIFSNLFWGIVIMACQKLLTYFEQLPESLTCCYSCFPFSSIKKSIVNSQQGV